MVPVSVQVRDPVTSTRRGAAGGWWWRQARPCTPGSVGWVIHSPVGW